VPCECGETLLHLIKRGDCEESMDCETFAWGYSCWVCGKRWEARDSDRLDHPDEYVDHKTIDLMLKRHWKQVKEIEELKAALEKK
jgi:hypothetical protein